MFLGSIAANQFRNLAGEIGWGHGLNILHGNNAQGKTNWLEAIYLLAHGKSFRTHHLKETVKFGERDAVVKGVVTTGNDLERELQVNLNGTTKQTLINGKREPISRYVAHLYAVCFTADELEVIRGGPEARRNFLDRGAISLHPPYAQTIVDYNKIIKQKKRLLQQAAEDRLSLEALASLVQPWNEQLVNLATQIHRARMRYVDLLNEALEHNLFHDDISIRYVSSLEGKGDLADYRALITSRLQLRMQAEVFAGACLIGPHRDDLLVLFGGRDIRSFGSSGQQRSALITLDLAAISVYYSRHQNYPIFLIDDVDAELDGNRINRLLEYLDGRTQTFITTSKRSHFERFENRANFYEVCAGVATREQAVNAVSVSA
ncbi:MAG TPA: DNA replication and repair protein RecF [Pyrinomonadaceae bacterium]|jgi:DNA replication and repair protein RecF|nr:DNA replication and repair protein RecF [Pyrinomonadaceae bacterium]